jgi:cytochrome c biogenesis protein CcdA
LCNIPLLISYIIKKKKKTAYWLIFTAISNLILGVIFVTETIGTLMLGLGLFSIVYATYHLMSENAQKYN